MDDAREAASRESGRVDARDRGEVGKGRGVRRGGAVVERNEEDRLNAIGDNACVGAEDGGFEIGVLSDQPASVDSELT